MIAKKKGDEIRRKRKVNDTAKKLATKKNLAAK